MPNSIKMIVAVGNKGVMGNGNDLPWHIPEDLKYFKEKTLGSSVVVGFKTLKSISRKLGRSDNLLPGRVIYVLTHNPDKVAICFPGCIALPDIESVLKLRDNRQVIIAGGKEVYEQFLRLPETRVIYMTRIYQDFPGDIVFPSLPNGEWETEEYHFHHANDDNSTPAMAFQTLIRKS